MASKSFLSQMRGFTLIEISIVLVVIGLLLSGGLVALAPVLENAKRTQTENTLTKIEDALLLYSIQNGCLPCPADGTGGTGAAEDSSGPQATTCTALACRTQANNDNTVPWLALGISESDSLDEWGTQITYFLSHTGNASQNTAPSACDNLQTTTSSNGTATGGFLRDNTTTPISFPQGCLDVENADPAGFGTNTVQAAYVLMSHGPDKRGGIEESGSIERADALAGNTVQLENDDGTCDTTTGSECHQGDPVDVEGNTYFDDIVRWKTAPIIVFQCGDGACGNP